jgi:tetratricopeptide (TPR) repeat protein
MDPQLKHHLGLGREFYQAGNYDEARPHLEAVLAAHDDFADVQMMLGVVRFESGDVAGARASFERALEINPFYTEAALNLSVCYNETGDYELAREIYDRARANPDRGGLERLDAFARGKIANLHREVGDAYAAVHLPDHAMKEYRKALRVCPTFPDIRTRLANMLRDGGQGEEALDEYEGVVQSSPGYVPAYLNYGIALWQAGRVSDARAQWTKALKLDPDNRTCGVYLKMTADKPG